MHIIKKSIFLLLLIITFTSCTYILNENDVLTTGTTLAAYSNTVVIGTVSNDSSSGYITIVEEKDDKWNIVFTYKIPQRYRGPVSLAMNEKYICAGLDVKQGKSGVVLVLKKENEKWKKAYYITSPKPYKDDLFGFSISLNNNQLLIGAKYYQNSGIAFLFELNFTEYKTTYIFNAPESSNKFFGQCVFLLKDSFIITDPGYSNEQIKDTVNKINEGKVYIFDKQNYKSKKSYSIKSTSVYSQLGMSGFLSEEKVLISDGGSLYLIDDANLMNEIWGHDKKLKFVLYSRSINYNYTFNDNYLIVSDTMYRFDQELKKANSINLICNDGELDKPAGYYYLHNDLLLCTDLNCDNYVERENQKQLLAAEKRKTGNPKTVVTPPINQGRVHIIRLLPETGYTEEAIIARRTNSKGKIEFYDMFAEECFNAE